jgi:hypothetical protein
VASSAPGRKALEHIDQVLAERPKKNDHVLSQATMCLSEFRDRLVSDLRLAGITPAQRKQLDHVNAVITVVLGIHFPLGEIPWTELEKARAWLAEVVEADEPVA